jgi:hypothetical protein
MPTRGSGTTVAAMSDTLGFPPGKSADDYFATMYSVQMDDEQ